MRYNKCDMAEAGMTLRWGAYEHEHVERGGDWYWALGIIAICCATVSVLFGNVLFAILIIFAAFLFALLARTPPEFVHFEVSARGVRVADVLHRYDEIISFWVEDEDGKEPLLLIDTTKPLSPNLVIPIREVDPHAVRLLLQKHTKEVPMREPLSHKVVEFFGL